MKEVLFDIKYRCFNGSEIYEIIIQEEVEKERVEEKIDKMFKNKNVVAVDVMKHGEKDVIFYHSVWSGTFINEKGYKAPCVTRKGKVVMVFGVDEKRKVYSKYPRWYRNDYECYDGELNILELLNSIE